METPRISAAVIDEYTRECLAIDVSRSTDAGTAETCLERLA